MFETIQQVLIALWDQDVAVLLAPGSASLIYLIITLFIWLESAFLPAAPLPCDSVVVLSGTLAALGVLEPFLIAPLLVIAAATGSALAFLQGRWLQRLPVVQRWLAKVSPQSMQRVDSLLEHHGLLALFCARFIPGARSLTPMMMGARLQSQSQFQWFAWLSALLWVCLLAGLGFLLPLLPEPISRVITMALMLAPMLTLLLALLAAAWLRYRRLAMRRVAGEA
ncbi:DedA family protein [Ferrimonas senticii]|uniref:DedA family protein n=1 Tax=Ferrimonas senticii TaxID=394566 RepID=UPI000400F539|nr:DedA family protein [Ferrimonas senticii]